MAVQNPYDQYQQNAVNSAEPGQLTLMLYTGAVKFTKLAVKYLDEKNYEQSKHKILRVQDFITELMVTLNHDYEIAKSLNSLYDYMKRRLVEANIKKDKQILLEVQNMLEELRSTWAEALKSLKTAGGNS